MAVTTGVGLALTTTDERARETRARYGLHFAGTSGGASSAGRQLGLWDQRNWPPTVALAASAAVWALFALSVVSGFDSLRTVAAVLDLGTWGVPIALAVRCRSGREFATIAGSSSCALLLLGGTIMVESRVTSLFSVAFLVVGAGSVVAQVGLRRLEAEPWRPNRAQLRAPSRANVGPLLRTVGWPAAVSIAGLGVVVATAASEQPLNPGLWGFPAATSLFWYGGTLLLLGALVGAVRARRGVGFSGAALVAALTASPALAYGLPRYTYAAKHIGVVNYILHYGRVHHTIDIYQAWPGLFSGIAWLARSGSVHDPLSIATIWPPCVDVGSVVLVACLAGRLTGEPYRAWLAGTVFALANAIGQDYFSPQAISLVLAVAMFSIALSEMPALGDGTRRRLSPGRVAILVLLSCALAVTHQVTPYLVTAALAVMVALGQARPVWLPVIPFAPAATWALANLDQVKKYFSVGTVGDVVANVATPGTNVSGAHKDLALQVSSYALAGGAVIVGLLAVIFVLRSRRRSTVAFALAAFSAVSLVVATNYGNEGIMRVTLFALPWLATLAIGGGRGALAWKAGAAGTLVGVLTLTFVLGDTVLDSFNAIRPGEVKAERVFETRAPAGSVIIGVGHGTFARLTYRYPQFTFLSMLLPRGLPASEVVTILDSVPSKNGHLYVETSDAGLYYSELQGLENGTVYTQITADLERSRNWRMVVGSTSAQLFVRSG